MKTILHKLTALAAVVTPIALIAFALHTIFETAMMFVAIGIIDLVLGVIWVIFAPYVMEEEG